MGASHWSTVSWKNVPTQMIAAGGTEFAYRELGAGNSVHFHADIVTKALEFLSR